MSRYIIEFGMGTDFHGQNVSAAAERAVRDAVSHSCLHGLSAVLGPEELDRDVNIRVTVAVSRPEEVDRQAIAACLPVGTVTVQAVEGGLKLPELCLSRLGSREDSVEAAIAALELEVQGH